MKRRHVTPVTQTVHSTAQDMKNNVKHMKGISAVESEYFFSSGKNSNEITSVFPSMTQQEISFFFFANIFIKAV